MPPEHWIYTIPLRLRSLFRRREADQELDEELRYHVESKTEEHITRGMTPQEARRAAMLEIGGVEKRKEECRDTRHVNWIQDLLQDVRYALRMLRKSPGFTLAIVLTLALGVGANVTMLDVVRRLLFRVPAHVLQPESVMRVDSVDQTGQPQMELAHYPGYRQLSEHARLLGVAAQSPTFAHDYGRGSSAREIEAQFITHLYFDVLGTQLLMGRPFSAQEESRTGSAVAILSYDFCKQEFGGDPQILNREIWIDGKPHAVIGVAPQGFTGLDLGTVDAWLPISDKQTSPGRVAVTEDTGMWWLQVIGRPVAGSTRDQAQDEATSAFRHAGGDPANTIRVKPYTAGLKEGISGSKEARVSLWLLGLALLVFLIACVNVTNLFLVRAIQRRHEMAVRLQLGAARGRLLRQLLTESLLVSLIGGVAALLLACWARPLVRAFLLPAKSYEGDFLGWRVVELTICFAVLAGVVGGLWAFPKVSQLGIPHALKSGRPLQERSTARSVLLVAQVALTLILSVGATLFVRSLRNVHAIPLGFDASYVLVATASTSGYNPTDINAAYERMRERAQALPRVEHAALACFIPFYGYGLGTFRISATNSFPERQVTAGTNCVGPEYFGAMGMEILRGRSFAPSDRTGAPPVAIVNESLAKQLVQDGNALGKCVMTYDRKDCLEVVGVVPDERRQFLFDDVPGQPKGSLYIPLYQAAGQFGIQNANGLVIRTRGNPSAIERSMRSALASVALGSRYVSVRPITEQIDHQTLPWRMGANVLTLFAGLALLLAAVGIFGLLAFLVKYRTAEIAVRLALGATPRHLLLLVLRRGMLLVIAGIATGTGAAMALARLMQSLLYGVAPTDLPSYVLAASIVLLVALLASYIPAQRAMRVDPMVALRHE